ncbi:MAG: hypothetical protein H0U57_06885 [Tatlockia sp.]|nr:hypothetical protein [Tatlockia sp.]
MKTLKIACVATLLASSISAYANTPCAGFEIKVKNHLADDLLVTTASVHGAELQPGGISKISAKTEQVFTVNNVNAETMKADIVLHTLSVPSKEVKISFDLHNGKLVCKHTDTSPESDYSVDKIRLPGKVDYVISNR